MSNLVFSNFDVGAAPPQAAIVPGWRSNTPRLIAFAGAAGAGKSTAADILVVVHGFKRVRFAGPLKDMLRAIGLSAEEIDGSLKEQPCALLGGRTPRHAMQTLGTEWGRELIHPDLWTDLWRRRAERIISTGGSVVVDDCRFLNEAALVWQLGGRIIKITGRGTAVAAHASEQQTLGCDEFIANDGDVGALAAELARVINRPM